MSKQDYPYPKDEFDVLGQERVPHGVHREPTPRWRVWLPYLLVIVLVPLLTFGAVKYFMSADDAPSASPTTTAAPSADPSGESPAPSEQPTATEGGEEPSEEPTEEPTTPELDHGVAVLVLNGAGVQGLAGRTTDALTGLGWTAATAGNYTNSAPAETTLYYHSAELEPEARAIGEQLGIDNLSESATAASEGIVIVLRAGFSAPAA
ncbi:LytR C-terminal domain-containing protein [Pseudactinotalea sp. HY158]|uniref:LytR C-terminal domain-containing protein n=1 Tax=Pseudactinotalea sp. HY158 TaxID=2654547 RepID=UPI00129C941C|nr:LytR C-terminal domain-containing protein [Pseudactinotalea sp. HY158]QGH68447.1 LytR family transcriptional regulator [Pseudactinotalea sp. HY158]